MIHYDFMSGTIVGNVCLASSGEGLCAVLIGDRTRKAFREKLTGMFPGESFAEDAGKLKAYRRELEEYFKWKRRWSWVRCWALAIGGVALWSLLWSLYE